MQLLQQFSNLVLSAFKDLYTWQRKNCKGPEFVLHDGPPYANGTPHMGHCINKILKDTVLRSKIIQGTKVHYRPGWDCHGLPIEMKAVASNLQKLTPLEIRSSARNFAKNTIAIQRDAFQSWGVVADWANPYLTFEKGYVKNQSEKFVELYEKGLVFREVKPVYWSPSSMTALAEAELEYNSQHSSTEVILRLKLATCPFYRDKEGIYALIWTTTPWTLPCNQAICFNPGLSYSIVKVGDKPEALIVASNLIKDVSKILNAELKVLSSFPGEALQGATYYHPFNREVLPFLPSDHATDTKGTGLVHTAPAHGHDDFLVALDHKLFTSSLVDENGCYTSSVGAKLAGLFVLTEGTKVVLDILKEDILHAGNYIHSYPYDWRTKQPIIIRASKQWFIDTNQIKHKAIEVLEQVQGLPKFNNEMCKTMLTTQILKRPYWCISRQRSWGVPIPVFYDARSDEPIINREILQRLFSLMDKYGMDYWWELSVSDLLPEDIESKCNVPRDQIRKGEDIFDIWLDSGLSWSNVLEGDQVADMYLEGVDQFTGWFQSSLMTSVALRNKSPYKSVYVHGFVVDQNGLKMSKSLGNVVDPVDILEGRNGMKTYGIDALRWWVVCHANSDAITHVSDNILQTSADEVQKIRSVLRFALGSLFDYEENVMHASHLLVIDKYMLHLLHNLHNKVFQAYNSYDYNRLSQYLINFVTNPVSALYYVAIKDRLYCDEQYSPSRQAAQFVLYRLAQTVAKCIAPITPHLTEELYLHFPQQVQDSFFHLHLNPETWDDPKIARLMENTILVIKKDLHRIVGANTLNRNVSIRLPEVPYQQLKGVAEDMNKELADILQVARVEIVGDAIPEFDLQISDTALFMCDRCRKHSAKCENDLCDRCNVICNTLKTEQIRS
ncbi:isoleucine--tRNA ligase, mitochondrial isoform X2 [Photinus pyralis]|uniref:isoleucine--tRNA ligase, mitochondrial isoform X2 n=1 Tax=Photinus pyralis TaxID=7054 RepID=UPI0012674B7E|nr:isoleucine--tRNA ligase, mitochondrial isoform X2 [Photinus pyralis]